MEVPVDRVAAETNTGVLPPEIHELMDHLQQARGKVQQIRLLLAEAQREREQAAQDHKEAFRKLAEDEAAVALDGSTANPALRKTALKANEAMIICDAKIAGLQARDAAAVAQVEESASVLALAMDAWVNTEIQRAREQLAVELPRFLDAIEVPLATGIALNDNRLITVAQRSQIADSSFDGGNAFERLRYWKQNPRMMGAVNKYVQARRAVADALAGARDLVARGADRAVDRPPVA
jgi:hypothetical protein